MHYNITPKAIVPVSHFYIGFSFILFFYVLEWYVSVLLNLSCKHIFITTAIGYGFCSLAARSLQHCCWSRAIVPKKGFTVPYLIMSAHLLDSIGHSSLSIAFTSNSVIIARIFARRGMNLEFVKTCDHNGRFLSTRAQDLLLVSV